MANVQYKHGSPDRLQARVCTFDADDDGWYFTPAATVKGTQVKCDWEHPKMPETFLPEDRAEDEDRGSFGMPTIGFGPGHVVTLPGDEASYQWPDNNPRVVPYEPAKVVLQAGTMLVEYGQKGYTMEAHTPEAEVIINVLVEEFLKLFLNKNLKYQAVQKGYDLGDKGIIPDLNRKLGILVDRLWNDSMEVGEDTDEVISDMIGHLFLMLAKRRLLR